MQLANQEAQRFNHEYIGTEHILLGLVKEGSGVAANPYLQFHTVADASGELVFEWEDDDGNRGKINSKVSHYRYPASVMA